MTERVDARGAALLLAGDRPVTLICHVNPDADAIGSTAALAVALQRAGRRVHATFDPGYVPAPLDRIPGARLIEPCDGVADHDGLVVILDCASVGRVGGAASLMETASEVLVLDHHRSNPGFGTHLYLDPDAASTCSLVTQILDTDVLDRAGVAIDADVATALYAGLATDTGSFRWGGAGSHATASRLLDAGADSEAMSFELLDAHGFDWLERRSQIVASARLDRAAVRGRGVVWLPVPHGALESLPAGDIESLVDEIRSVREAAVAVLLKEYTPGCWSVSFRSRDGVDVGQIATALGGGGHRAAAGCTLEGSETEVAAQVRDALG